MQLTQDQLKHTITEISGATFAQIQMRTEPKMRKTGNPFMGRVEKISTSNVTLGAIYENSVNRQSGREDNPKKGDFKAQSLQWGEWLIPNKIITHKGKLYLRAQVNAHMVPDVEFEIDGKPVTGPRKFYMESFIQTRKPSKRQTEEQGNEKEVKPFTVAFDNIETIKEGGTVYQIV